MHVLSLLCAHPSRWLSPSSWGGLLACFTNVFLFPAQESLASLFRIHISTYIGAADFWIGSGKLRWNSIINLPLITNSEFVLLTYFNFFPAICCAKLWAKSGSKYQVEKCSSNFVHDYFHFTSNSKIIRFRAILLFFACLDHDSLPRGSRDVSVNIKCLQTIYLFDDSWFCWHIQAVTMWINEQLANLVLAMEKRTAQNWCYVWYSKPN